MDGDTLHGVIEWETAEFGRMIWNMQQEKSFDETTSWLEVNVPTFRQFMSAFTVTSSEDDQSMVGRKFWILTPPQVTTTIHFESAK